MSISYCSLDEAWSVQPNASIDEGTNYTGGNIYKTDMRSVLQPQGESMDQNIDEQFYKNNDGPNGANGPSGSSNYTPFQQNVLLGTDSGSGSGSNSNSNSNNDRNKQIVPAPNGYLNCLNYTTSNNDFIDRSIMIQQLMLIIQRMEKKIDKLEEKVDDEGGEKKQNVVEGFGNMKTNSMLDYIVLVFMGIVIIFVMDSIMKMGKKLKA
jgi:hypothetical protein